MVKNTNKASNAIPLIYVFSLLLLLTTCDVDAKAFSTYQVDWPTSKSGQHHTLRVTIEDCETSFSIKDKDLSSLREDKNSKQSLLQAAIKRYNNNCKD